MKTIGQAIEAAKRCTYYSGSLIMVWDTTTVSIWHVYDWDASVEKIGDKSFESAIDAWLAMCDTAPAMLATDLESHQMDRDVADQYSEALDDLCPDWRERFFPENAQTS